MQASLKMLNEQGEKLDEIDEKNQKIGRNLERGNRLVDSIGTWKGFFKGLIWGHGEDQVPEKKQKKQLDEKQE